MQSERLVALFACFEDLTDPRVERTRRHELFDMVVLALSAALCGADCWVDVQRFGWAKRKFFAQFLALPNGIPSHDTFDRVFAALDTEEFLHCISAWLQQLAFASNGKLVALDGKTLRGSLDRANFRSALHLVSAWAHENRLVLGQVAVDDKSNEITAIPQLLAMLELTGATVTMDAIGCQKAIAATLRERGADYVLAVKGNQPTLLEAVQTRFMQLADNHYQGAGVRQLVTIEKARGGLERRHYVIAPVPAALKAHGEWKDVQSIGMVVRTFTRDDGTQSSEVRYYLSSHPPKVKLFARAVRGHWGIENTLHWSLDVTFAEDKSRIRKGHGPHNCAILRRLALMILHQDTSVHDNIRGKRKLAGWDDEVLLKLLTGFSGK